MKGGSIIGQGGYGCAFRPALLCRGLKKGKGKVGKITSHEDANNELKVARYLKTLPDSEKYAVFAESSCIPRALSKQDEADINKCQILEKLDIKDTIQILMPYGGSSLNRINLHPTQFNFFKCMEGILMAGAYFLKNDLCHFDISERNIVVDKHTSARFIDFGF
jgi:serine/threonine protein kinase